MITKEIIHKILAKKLTDCEDLASDLALEIAKIENIKAEIKSLHREIEKELIKYEEKKKVLEAGIKMQQEKCEHWTTNFHPDPSGNNDSYYECAICGKDV